MTLKFFNTSNPIYCGNERFISKKNIQILGTASYVPQTMDPKIFDYEITVKILGSIV